MDIAPPAPVSIDANDITSKYQQEVAQQTYRAVVAEVALAATQAALAEAHAQIATLQRAVDGQG